MSPHRPDALLRRMLIAVSCVTLCGCSDVPDALLYVTGTARDETGQPVAGAPVLLLRDVSEGCDRTVAPPGQPLPPGDFRPLRSTMSRVDGRFVLERFEAETALRSSSGVVPGTCFLLTLDDGSPEQTRLHFSTYQADVPVGSLPRWGVPPSAAQLGEAIQLNVLAPPRSALQSDLVLSPLDARFPPYEWQWELSSGDQQIWAQPLDPDHPEAPLSAYAREDFTGVQARAHLAGGGHEASQTVWDSSFAEFSLSATSASIPLEAGTRVPVSRGAQCEYPEAPAGPCPLTDGDVHGVVITPLVGLLHVHEIQLQLARPAQLRWAVLRNGSFDDDDVTLDVQGSRDDGATWILLGRLGPMPHAAHFAELGPGVFAEAPLDAGAPAVDRIKFTLSSGDIQGLGELSLFE